MYLWYKINRVGVFQREDGQAWLQNGAQKPYVQEEPICNEA